MPWARSVGVRSYTRQEKQSRITELVFLIGETMKRSSNPIYWHLEYSNQAEIIGKKHELERLVGKKTADKLITEYLERNIHD